ncbi:hypothetical protein SGLAM104S_01060 [Streptomyces glaucescens]
MTTTLEEVLEQRLGDPFDAANPHGFDAVLAAAEGRRPWTRSPGTSRPAHPSP